MFTNTSGSQNFPGILGSFFWRETQNDSNWKGWNWDAPLVEMPTFNKEMPTFNKEMPTFNKEMPTFNKEMPTFNKEMPTFNKEMPTFNKEMPTYNKEMPTFNKEMPTFKKEMPAFNIRQIATWKLNTKQQFTTTKHLSRCPKWERKHIMDLYSLYQ